MEAKTATSTGMLEHPKQHFMSLKWHCDLQLSICQIAPGQEDLDLADAVRTSGSGGNDAPIQSFEWITHGDATARRRARAHVSREIRRHKAAQPQPQEDFNDNRKEKRYRSHIPNSKGDIEATASVASPAVEKYPVQRLMLHKALGLGQTDPFASFPVRLTPDTNALLDHCKSPFFTCNILKITD
jgi:hypothetical protein